MTIKDDNFDGLFGFEYQIELEELKDGTCKARVYHLKDGIEYDFIFCATCPECAEGFFDWIIPEVEETDKAEALKSLWCVCKDLIEHNFVPVDMFGNMLQKPKYVEIEEN